MDPFGYNKDELLYENGCACVLEAEKQRRILYAELYYHDQLLHMKGDLLMYVAL